MKLGGRRRVDKHAVRLTPSLRGGEADRIRRNVIYHNSHAFGRPKPRAQLRDNKNNDGDESQSRIAV